MRALIQRSKNAHVAINGETVASIDRGLVVFLGLGVDDTFAKGQKLIDKILNYRLFDDERGKMSYNIRQAGGGILLVSQFTLYANTNKGLRPDFGAAMPPAQAQPLYQQLVAYFSSQFTALETGIFAADMQVQLINDGPVTFLLDV